MDKQQVIDDIVQHHDEVVEYIKDMVRAISSGNEKKDMKAIDEMTTEIFMRIAGAPDIKVPEGMTPPQKPTKK